MVFKLEDSCSLEKNSDKLLIRGMEPAEQNKPSETLLPANCQCHHCQYMVILRLKEMPNVIAMVTLFWRKI